MELTEFRISLFGSWDGRIWTSHGHLPVSAGVPWSKLSSGKEEKTGARIMWRFEASFVWQIIPFHHSPRDKKNMLASIWETIGMKCWCCYCWCRPGWMLQLININGCQTMQSFVEQSLSVCLLSANDSHSSVYVICVIYIYIYIYNIYKYIYLYINND